MQSLGEALTLGDRVGQLTIVLRPLLLAFTRGCSKRPLVLLLRMTQRSLAIGDRLLEGYPPCLKFGELRSKVGFAYGQPIAIGTCGLMLTTNLIEHATDLCDRLFGGRTAGAFALNQTIELRFSFRRLLARQETIPCRPGRRIVKCRLRGSETAVEVVATRCDLDDQIVELGLTRGQARDVVQRGRILMLRL